MSDKAVAARVLRDVAHMPADDIAELFRVHPSTVYRWLEDTETPLEHSAVDDLESLLATQDLDDLGKMNAGIAHRLAAKLDKASASDKAADSMAVPALAKELRAVVAEIMGASTDDKEWLAHVFAPVGDSTDPGAPDTGAADGQDRGSTKNAVHAVASPRGRRGDGDSPGDGQAGV